MTSIKKSESHYVRQSNRLRPPANLINIKMIKFQALIFRLSTKQTVSGVSINKIQQTYNQKSFSFQKFVWFEPYWSFHFQNPVSHRRCRLLFVKRWYLGFLLPRWMPLWMILKDSNDHLNWIVYRLTLDVYCCKTQNHRYFDNLHKDNLRDFFLKFNLIKIRFFTVKFSRSWLENTFLFIWSWRYIEYR